MVQTGTCIHQDGVRQVVLQLVHGPLATWAQALVRKEQAIATWEGGENWVQHMLRSVCCPVIVEWAAREVLVDTHDNMYTEHHQPRFTRVEERN